MSMKENAEPHQNIEAERAVLGAALLDDDALAKAETILTEEDFYHPSHATIFAAMRACSRRGEPMDLLLLCESLKEKGTLQAVGGAKYLAEITDFTVTTAHVEHHAKIVATLATARRHRAAYQRAIHEIDKGADPLEVQRRVAAVALSPNGTHRARRIGELLIQAFEVFHARAVGTLTPVATPWPTVNTLLGGGLFPGVHFLIGGTGSGKTQWALQVALHTARAGRPVVYVGLELGPEDLTARVLGLQTGTPWSALFRGTDSDTLGMAIHQGERALRDLPLWLEFAPPFGWQADRMLTLARAHRPALLVIDFLQVVAPQDPREDARTRVGRVAYLARALGRDLGVAVLALSSTARGNYADFDVPVDEVTPGSLLGVGKESGEIEYSADTVMVLGRGPMPTYGTGIRTAWISIEKQRAGCPGVAPLRFNGHRFEGPPEAIPIKVEGIGRS
jgi:replicative DNA helicase